MTGRETHYAHNGHVVVRGPREKRLGGVIEIECIFTCSRNLYCRIIGPETDSFRVRKVARSVGARPARNPVDYQLLRTHDARLVPKRRAKTIHDSSLVIMER